MGIPNKAGVAIPYQLDPNYTGEEGNQTTQYFLIPNSQYYRSFTIAVIPDSGAATLTGIYGSVGGGHTFVNGVVGGAPGNGLVLPTYYLALYDCLTNISITVDPVKLNMLDCTTVFKGGVVLQLADISGAGKIYVQMSGSGFSNDAPGGAA